MQHLCTLSCGFFGWIFIVLIFFLLLCRRFGPRCNGCDMVINPNDLVRKAKDRIFHLNCFKCYVCQQRLDTGDKLYVMSDGSFVCKEDYLAGNHGNMHQAGKEEKYITHSEHPTSQFTILEPPWIDEFYIVEERRGADLKAHRLWKGSSGSLAMKSLSKRSMSKSKCVSKRKADADSTHVLAMLLKTASQLLSFAKMRNVTNKPQGLFHTFNNLNKKATKCIQGVEFLICSMPGN